MKLPTGLTCSRHPQWSCCSISFGRELLAETVEGCSHRHECYSVSLDAAPYGMHCHVPRAPPPASSGRITPLQGVTTSVLSHSDTADLCTRATDARAPTLITLSELPSQSRSWSRPVPSTSTFPLTPLKEHRHQLPDNFKSISSTVSTH